MVSPMPKPAIERYGTAVVHCGGKYYENQEEGKRRLREA